MTLDKKEYVMLCWIHEIIELNGFPNIRIAKHTLQSASFPEKISLFAAEWFKNFGLGEPWL